MDDRRSGAAADRTVAVSYRVIAYDIMQFDRLGSTSDEARRLAASGAAHGTVVTACQQTAGRGRHSRRWVSPPGNVYLSMLLRLDLPPARVAELGFAIALAVADAVDTFVPGRAMLKWPNDVLVDGAKISGILLELSADTVIVGIGLNVLHVPETDARSYPATSLALAGATGTSVAAAREAVLESVARWLEAWQTGGFAPVRAAWLARAHPLGTALRVTLADGTIAGRFAGIGSDGALLLDVDGGTRRVIAGDVVMG